MALSALFFEGTKLWADTHGNSALELFLKGAAQGDAVCALCAGLMYEYGFSGMSDKQKAVPFFARASNSIVPRREQ